jgi:inosose dehydratase
VWEATIDRDDLVAPDRLLAAMRECGHTRLELGPAGYFGSTPELAAQRLREAEMTMVGAFVPLRLAEPDATAADDLVLHEVLETLACFADDEPLVILADAGSPERVRAAGKPARLRETSLEGAALRAASERLMRVAEACRDRGLGATFHHHAESYFESPEEVDALLDQLDAELVGLCFDTGHALIGDGDPLELMCAWAHRITHLHLKDVEPALLSELRAGDVGIEAAWERGLFCPLGAGAVDFDGLFASPELRAFHGIAVLEQDRVAVTENELANVARVEAANLAYVAERTGASAAAS